MVRITARLYIYRYRVAGLPPPSEPFSPVSKSSFACSISMGVTHVNNHRLSSGFAWDDRRLQFTVREPFLSQTTGVELLFGALTDKSPLRLESKMQEKGVIFMDGFEADNITFNSGTIATIGGAKTQGRLICN